MQGLVTSCFVSLLALSALLLSACGARTIIGSSEYEDAGLEAGTDAAFDAPSDVVHDHVNDINGCNPSTCAGCCDPYGNCRTGMEASACGSGGFECVDCTAFSATCNASTRTCGPPQLCNASTCPNGCCASETECLDGKSHDACGVGGKACVSCPTGSSCNPDYQVCVGSGDCGPWNCGGCCDLWDTCNWGSEPWACGMGGGLCEDCISQGLVCDFQTFTCTGSQECGPWNCPGCCDWYGYCNWGGDDWACGGGGEPCTDCWSSGLACDPYALTCAPPQDCGPWNCPGCCDWYGYCNWGGDDWACGSNGDYCENCTWFGGQCDPNMKMCSMPQDCGPWNCSGCCTNTFPSSCVSGLEPLQCGSGGQMCMPCAPDQPCYPQSWGGGSCGGYPDGGVIDSGTPDCGPWNCSGCCMPGYPPTCMSGYDHWACGYGGQICESCNNNQTCQATPMGGGVCTNTSVPDAGSSCGPWNCSGCCTPQGQCRPGKSDMRCGTGGEACKNCSIQNLTCVNGDCTP